MATDPHVARRKRLPNWMFLALAVVLGVAAGLLVFALQRIHATSPGSSAASSMAPDAVWAAAQLRAPDFRLTDQNGHPVSVAPRTAADRHVHRPALPRFLSARSQGPE